MMSSVLTWNIFHTLFQCFHCWLWKINTGREEMFLLLWGSDFCYMLSKDTYLYWRILSQEINYVWCLQLLPLNQWRHLINKPKTEPPSLLKRKILHLQLSFTCYIYIYVKKPSRNLIIKCKLVGGLYALNFLIGHLITNFQLKRQISIY